MINIWGKCWTVSWTRACLSAKDCLTRRTKTKIRKLTKIKCIFKFIFKILELNLNESLWIYLNWLACRRMLFKSPEIIFWSFPRIPGLFWRVYPIGCHGWTRDAWGHQIHGKGSHDRGWARRHQPRNSDIH